MRFFSCLHRSALHIHPPCSSFFCFPCGGTKSHDGKRYSTTRQCFLSFQSGKKTLWTVSGGDGVWRVEEHLISHDLFIERFIFSLAIFNSNRFSCSYFRTNISAVQLLAARSWGSLSFAEANVSKCWSLASLRSLSRYGIFSFSFFFCSLTFKSIYHTTPLPLSVSHHCIVITIPSSTLYKLWCHQQHVTWLTKAGAILLHLLQSSRGSHPIYLMPAY